MFFGPLMLTLVLNIVINGNGFIYGSMESVKRAFKSLNNINYTHLLSLCQIEAAYASSGSLIGQSMLKIVLKSVFSTIFSIF